MEHGYPVAFLAPERAHDDSVGVREVRDRSALGEKLGVRDVTDIGKPVAVEPRAYPFAGSGRNGAFHDEHESFGGIRQLVDHLPDGTQIRVPRVRGRSPDADEHKLSPVKHVSGAGGEPKAIAIPVEELSETRFVDRDPPSLEVRDPHRFDVADDHVVTEVGVAGGGDKTHPAGSHDADRLPHGPTAGKVSRTPLVPVSRLSSVFRRPSSNSMSGCQCST